MRNHGRCKTPSSIHSSPVSAPALQLVRILTLLYSVFVIYGSLVPLHFVPMPFDEAIAAFKNIPFLNLGIDSRADWVANVLLFIPLAFLCNQLATYNKTGIKRHLSSIVSFSAMVGIAFGIEFIQLFFPHRTVSQNDIWAEGFGSVIGIISQYLWGIKFETWLDALWHHESGNSRLKRALNVYLVILLVFSVLPLDLTISPVELYHKWAEGRVVLVPFGGLKGGFSENFYETLTDLLVWLPVGLLWGLDTKYPVVRITAMGLLAAAFIEAAQLFVYSRVTDVTDILLAGIGTATGALIARRERMIFRCIGSPNQALWFSLWILWALSILAIFWFPYDFDASRVTLSRTQATVFRPLLENYYFGSEFHAANEVLRKIGFFLPGGILWGFATHLGTDSKRKSNVKGGLALFAVALLVEIGQLYLPQKYADLTDILIQGTGGLLGLAFARWVLSGHSALNQLLPDDQTVSSLLPVTEDKTYSIGWNPHLVTFAGLAAIVGTITRLPFVPYNVRELVEPGLSGVLSVIGLSLAIQWLITGNFIFLRRCKLKRGEMIYLPVWILIHAGVTWIFLRLAVPLESIQDIVGSPILGWPWEWEILGRYLALHGAIALQIIGAMILIDTVSRQSRLEIFLTWLIWCFLLAWPLHWIVVDQAATDNLTELMRDGGSFVSSTQIAFGLFCFFVAGSAISFLIRNRFQYRSLVFLSGIAILVAGLCFWFGSEQVIIKYQKVFSAWQFLLSADRDNYVAGARLYFRFALVFSLLLGCLSFIQAPFWKLK